MRWSIASPLFDEDHNSRSRAAEHHARALKNDLIIATPAALHCHLDTRKRNFDMSQQFAGVALMCANQMRRPATSTSTSSVRRHALNLRSADRLYYKFPWDGPRAWMLLSQVIALERKDNLHIAIVDDHKEIRGLLSRYLSENGYRVSAAEDASEMRSLLETSAPDLVILDIMMPGEDGLSLCRFLRETTNIPVILLTAISAETDRIIGLEIGADDYVTKPFSARELLARVKAVLRRTNSMPPKTQRPKSQRLRFGSWVLDVSRRELLGRSGLATPLSTAEYRLLMVLLDHPQMVLTRNQLLDLTVGRVTDVFDRSVDNQISRLRKKIEEDPRNPELIKTHWGGGYCFTAEVEAA